MQPDLKFIIFLIFVGGFTMAASYFDFRFRKIPNKLTLPMFIAGLIFKLGFNGWSGAGSEGFIHLGLADALVAFSVGFGMLFVLWMIGGGGGGDVKLMGALSVWLGFQLTLQVLIVSTLFVLAGTLLVLLVSVMTKGPWKTKQQYVAAGKKEQGKQLRKETISQRKNRRIMAYAIPIALATWSVLIYQSVEMMAKAG